MNKIIRHDYCKELSLLIKMPKILVLVIPCLNSIAVTTPKSCLKKILTLVKDLALLMS